MIPLKVPTVEGIATPARVGDVELQVRASIIRASVGNQETPLNITDDKIQLQLIGRRRTLGDFGIQIPTPSKLNFSVFSETYTRPVDIPNLNPASRTFPDILPSSVLPDDELVIRFNYVGFPQQTVEYRCFIREFKTLNRRNRWTRLKLQSLSLLSNFFIGTANFLPRLNQINDPTQPVDGVVTARYIDGRQTIGRFFSGRFLFREQEDNNTTLLLGDDNRIIANLFDDDVEIVFSVGIPQIEYVVPQVVLGQNNRPLSSLNPGRVTELIQMVYEAVLAETESNAFGIRDNIQHSRIRNASGDRPRYSVPVQIGRLTGLRLEQNAMKGLGNFKGADYNSNLSRSRVIVNPNENILSFYRINMNSPIYQKNPMRQAVISSDEGVVLYTQRGTGLLNGRDNVQNIFRTSNGPLPGFFHDDDFSEILSIAQAIRPSTQDRLTNTDIRYDVLERSIRFRVYMEGLNQGGIVVGDRQNERLSIGKLFQIVRDIRIATRPLWSVRAFNRSTGYYVQHPTTVISDVGAEFDDDGNPIPLNERQVGITRRANESPNSNIPLSDLEFRVDADATGAVFIEFILGQNEIQRIRDVLDKSFVRASTVLPASPNVNNRYFNFTNDLANLFTREHIRDTLLGSEFPNSITVPQELRFRFEAHTEIEILLDFSFIRNNPDQDASLVYEFTEEIEAGSTETEDRSILVDSNLTDSQNTIVYDNDDLYLVDELDPQFDSSLLFSYNSRTKEGDRTYRLGQVIARGTNTPEIDKVYLSYIDTRLEPLDVVEIQSPQELYEFMIDDVGYEWTGGKKPKQFQTLSGRIIETPDVARFIPVNTGPTSLSTFEGRLLAVKSGTVIHQFNPFAPNVNIGRSISPTDTTINDYRGFSEGVENQFRIYVSGTRILFDRVSGGNLTITLPNNARPETSGSLVMSDYYIEFDGTHHNVYWHNRLTRRLNKARVDDAQGTTQIELESTTLSSPSQIIDKITITRDRRIIVIFNAGISSAIFIFPLPDNLNTTPIITRENQVVDGRLDTSIDLTSDVDSNLYILTNSGLVLRYNRDATNGYVFVRGIDYRLIEGIQRETTFNSIRYENRRFLFTADLDAYVVKDITFNNIINSTSDAVIPIPINVERVVRPLSNPIAVFRFTDGIFSINSGNGAVRRYDAGVGRFEDTFYVVPTGHTIIDAHHTINADGDRIILLFTQNGNDSHIITLNTNRTLPASSRARAYLMEGTITGVGAFTTNAESGFAVRNTPITNTVEIIVSSSTSGGRLYRIMLDLTSTATTISFSAVSAFDIVSDNTRVKSLPDGRVITADPTFNGVRIYDEPSFPVPFNTFEPHPLSEITELGGVQLGSIADIDCDQSGNIYLVDNANKRIVRMNSSLDFNGEVYLRDFIDIRELDESRATERYAANSINIGFTDFTNLGLGIEEWVGITNQNTVRDIGFIFNINELNTSNIKEYNIVEDSAEGRFQDPLVASFEYGEMVIATRLSFAFFNQRREEYIDSQTFTFPGSDPLSSDLPIGTNDVFLGDGQICRLNDVTYHVIREADAPARNAQRPQGSGVLENPLQEVLYLISQETNVLERYVLDQGTEIPLLFDRIRKVWTNYTQSNTNQLVVYAYVVVDRGRNIISERRLVRFNLTGTFGSGIRAINPNATATGFSDTTNGVFIVQEEIGGETERVVITADNGTELNVYSNLFNTQENFLLLRINNLGEFNDETPFNIDAMDVDINGDMYVVDNVGRRIIRLRRDYAYISQLLYSNIDVLDTSTGGIHENIEFDEITITNGIITLKSTYGTAPSNTVLTIRLNEFPQPTLAPVAPPLNLRYFDVESNLEPIGLCFTSNGGLIYGSGNTVYRATESGNVVGLLRLPGDATARIIDLSCNETHIYVLQSDNSNLTRSILIYNNSVPETDPSDPIPVVSNPIRQLTSTTAAVGIQFLDNTLYTLLATSSYTRLLVSTGGPTFANVGGGTITVDILPQSRPVSKFRILSNAVIFISDDRSTIYIYPSIGEVGNNLNSTIVSGLDTAVGVDSDGASNIYILEAGNNGRISVINRNDYSTIIGTIDGELFREENEDITYTDMFINSISAVSGRAYLSFSSNGNGLSGFRVITSLPFALIKRTYGQNLLTGTPLPTSQRLNVPNEICADATNILVAQGDANLYEFNLLTGARTVRSGLGTRFFSVQCDDNYIYAVDRLGGGGGTNDLRVFNRDTYEQVGTNLDFNNANNTLSLRDGVVMSVRVDSGAGLGASSIYVSSGVPGTNLAVNAYSINYPTGWNVRIGQTIAMSPTGRIYVVTRGQATPFVAGILIYDSIVEIINGLEPQNMIGNNGIGTANNQFGNGLLVNDLGFHDGNLYVMDADNDRIQVFRENTRAHVRTISFSDLAVDGEDASAVRFNRFNILNGILYVSGNRTTAGTNTPITNSGFVRRIENIL